LSWSFGTKPLSPVSEIFNAECRPNAMVEMTLIRLLNKGQGQFILVPIDFPHTTFYRLSIVLGRTVYHIPQYIPYRGRQTTDGRNTVPMQGSFPKKITLGTPSSSTEGARIEVWGGEGVLPLTRKIFRFWILNGRILV